MVVFGQKRLYSVKFGCIWSRTGCTWAKWLFSCKVIVFWQGDCIRSKVVVIRCKSGCIWTKVVVFGQKWLYSGKSGYVWAKLVVFCAKWLYSKKCVVFLQKWLYSGVFLFGQN